MRESVESRGLECHNDTRLCHSNKSLKQVKCAGGDLVP